jgi:hypothetical protein
MQFGGSGDRIMQSRGSGDRKGGLAEVEVEKAVLRKWR